MLVECKNTDILTLENEQLKREFLIYYQNLDDRLFIGRKYVVYTIIFSVMPFVFIVEEDDDESYCYPKAYPIGFFKILDNRLSKYFVYGETGLLAYETNLLSCEGNGKKFSFFDKLHCKILKFFNYHQKAYLKKQKALNDQLPILTFKEWLDEEYFYDKLSDYENKEQNFFLTYKKLMDYEFINPNITSF